MRRARTHVQCCELIGSNINPAEKDTIITIYIPLAVIINVLAEFRCVFKSLVKSDRTSQCIYIYNCAHDTIIIIFNLVINKVIINISYNNGCCIAEGTRYITENNCCIVVTSINTW